MPEDVRVKTEVVHYDKRVGRKRTEGEVYEIPADSAQRRVDKNLVTILKNKSSPPEDPLSPVEEIKQATGVGAVPDEENLGREYPDEMPEAQESTSETEEESEEAEDEEFDPWDYIDDSRGGSWYDVEGHDDNPVQGKDAAESIASELHEE